MGKWESGDDGEARGKTRNELKRVQERKKEAERESPIGHSVRERERILPFDFVNGLSQFQMIELEAKSVDRATSECRATTMSRNVAGEGGNGRVEGRGGLGGGGEGDARAGEGARHNEP